MSNDTRSTVGSMRFTADKRQIGGLLMLTGFAGIIQSIFDIATAIGAHGNSPTQGLGLVLLIGGFFVNVTGILSVVLGYMETVHDMSFKPLTALALVVTQPVWIGYVGNMVGVGQAIKSTGFMMPDLASMLQPTLSDKRLMGSMGILAIVAYGFGLVGSIAFFQFSLFAFQNGKPGDRNSHYFRGRLGVYAFMYFLAGLTQLILGAYIIARFGVSPGGPIQVAFYLINVPVFSVVVGLVQALNGLWGYLRAHGMLTFGHNDSSYQTSIAVGWLIQMALQVIGQASWLPGPVGAPLAPVVAAFSIGQTVMPAYLDYKMRNTPLTIEAAYYGEGDDGKDSTNTEQDKVEMMERAEA